MEMSNGALISRLFSNLNSKARYKCVSEWNDDKIAREHETSP